jgi:hypothetical protein
VAATESTRRRRRGARRRAALRRFPWLVAGLGGLAVRGAAAQSFVDSRVLFYKEADGRTQVIDPVLLWHQELGETKGQLDLTLGFDSISGASPTGGYPTFDVTTSASGRTTASGTIPLASYKDQRKALSAAYSRRFGAHLPTVDLSYSKENDYTARGTSLSDAWTMLEGRGTLHYGVSLSSDIVAPATNNLELPKRSNGFSLGWTWIIGERDLVDVSGSLTRLSGYLDDPYKVVPIGSSANPTNVPEHRPDSRSRIALVARYGHHTGNDSAIKGAYRFYTDDWGIRAHAIEVSYDQRLGSDWVVSPEVRLYVQSAASFYGSLFVQPEQYMSADYRLSSFWSALAGLKVACEVTPSLRVYGSVTYQSQRGSDRIELSSAASRRDDGEGSGSTSVSAADLRVMTVTIGFMRRF